MTKELLIYTIITSPIAIGIGLLVKIIDNKMYIKELERLEKERKQIKEGIKYNDKNTCSNTKQNK